mgnify:CR=1 FL=1
MENALVTDPYSLPSGRIPFSDRVHARRSHGKASRRSSKPKFLKGSLRGKKGRPTGASYANAVAQYNEHMIPYQIANLHQMLATSINNNKTGVVGLEVAGASINRRPQVQLSPGEGNDASKAQRMDNKVTTMETETGGLKAIPNFINYEYRGYSIRIPSVLHETLLNKDSYGLVSPEEARNRRAWIERAFHSKVDAYLQAEEVVKSLINTEKIRSHNTLTTEQIFEKPEHYPIRISHQMAAIMLEATTAALNQQAEAWLGGKIANYFDADQFLLRRTLVPYFPADVLEEQNAFLLPSVYKSYFDTALTRVYDTIGQKNNAPGWWNGWSRAYEDYVYPWLKQYRQDLAGNVISERDLYPRAFINENELPSTYIYKMNNVAINQGKTLAEKLAPHLPSV